MTRILRSLPVFFVLIPVLIAGCRNNNIVQTNSSVIIHRDRWFLNGKIMNEGSPAEGLLMSVRMVNSVFEDLGDSISKHAPGFNPETNTDSFISKIPEYRACGINAFTVSLQGGSPGYEGAINSAFNSDGSTREEYLQRIEKVITSANKAHAAVILSCFYQRQSSNFLALDGKESIISAVRNTVNWITRNKFTECHA